MKDTNYHVMVTSIWQGTNDDTTWMNCYKIEQGTISTTGFSVYSRSSTTKRFKWSVSGYLP